MSLLTNLIASYELNEASSNALDSHGGLTATETSGTIGASTGPGGVGGSRDFERDETEYFAIADSADLSMGDIDFTVEAWCNLESKPAGEMDIISKYETVGNQREYRIRWDHIFDEFQFLVSSNGADTSVTIARWNPAPSLATWYQIIAWHDSTANQTAITVNDGTPETKAHTGGVFDGTSPFHIGSLGRAAPTFYFDGLIAKVRLWKRLLTSDERTQLYNAGAGLAYSSFSSAIFPRDQFTGGFQRALGTGGFQRSN